MSFKTESCYIYWNLEDYRFFFETSDEGARVKSAVITAYNEDLNKVVGKIDFSFTKESCFLQCIEINRNFRNKGIGTALIKIMEEVLYEKEISKIVGHFVPEEEYSARKFYEKNGFEFEDKRSNTVLTKTIDFEKFEFNEATQIVEVNFDKGYENTNFEAKDYDDEEEMYM